MNEHHIFTTSNLENLDCNSSKIKSAFATGFYFDLLFWYIRKMHEQFRHIIQQHTNSWWGKKVKCVSRGVHIKTINLKFRVYRKTILQPHIYKLKCNIPIRWNAEFVILYTIQVCYSFLYQWGIRENTSTKTKHLHLEFPLHS